jgi:hypothetical protein
VQEPKTTNNRKQNILIPELKSELWRVQDKFGTMEKHNPFMFLIISCSYQWFVNYGSRPVATNYNNRPRKNHRRYVTEMSTSLAFFTECTANTIICTLHKIRRFHTKWQWGLFWDVEPCSLVHVYRRFRAAFSLQSSWWRQKVNLKRRLTYTKLHGVTSMKTVVSSLLSLTPLCYNPTTILYMSVKYERDGSVRSQRNIL